MNIWWHMVHMFLLQHHSSYWGPCCHSWSSSVQWFCGGSEDMLETRSLFTTTPERNSLLLKAGRSPVIHNRVTHLGWRWRELLQVSVAAVFMTDEASPQHWAATGRTLSLHRQELRRLRPQEVFGETGHMTAHPTGRVETAQLLWRLRETRDGDEETNQPGRGWADWVLRVFTLTEPRQRQHLDASSSSSSSSAVCGRCTFLALTLPNAMGMCRGGCRLGSKSILYSCLSQRAVSGSLLHGAARSMLDTTRQWNWRLDSFLRRRDTWESRLEEWGCCHAHSNWHRNNTMS